MANDNLHTAKSAKNDEFYTQLSDIEKELKHYKKFFKDKIVYCNCDNPQKSEFCNFFRLKFTDWGLKKLIVTCITEDKSNGKAYIWDRDTNGNGIMDDDEVQVFDLNYDGSFDCPQCIEYLDECDVVVTNPPFSLFREYVTLLMNHNKKFLIIGNQNAITYKEIFPYIKNNELWLGVSMNGSNRWFEVPDNYPVKENAAGYKEENGKRLLFVNGVVWFTNISNEKRNTPLDLYKKYSADEYPTYDNYDAIEVSKVADIPYDYTGIMGVPITFLNSYCPDQFEIVDINPHFFSTIAQGLQKPKQLTLKNVNKKDPYARILIRFK